MQRLRIAIDIDDVLAEYFHSPAARQYGHVGGAFDVLERLSNEHHVMIATSRCLQMKHCMAVTGEGCHAILFGDYAWNRAEGLPDFVKRYHDWTEVEAAIDRIANQ